MKIIQHTCLKCNYCEYTTPLTKDGKYLMRQHIIKKHQIEMEEFFNKMRWKNGKKLKWMVRLDRIHELLQKTQKS